MLVSLGQSLAILFRCAAPSTRPVTRTSPVHRHRYESETQEQNCLSHLFAAAHHEELFFALNLCRPVPTALRTTSWSQSLFGHFWGACRRLQCYARQSDRSDPFGTRLAINITSIPYRIDTYFQDCWWRKALWSGSAFGTGYYAANTVSLSFGALAINDVVAAATTVGFCEIVSIAFWSADEPGLWRLFANCFKLGVQAALIADAFKLAG